MRQALLWLLLLMAPCVVYAGNERPVIHVGTYQDHLSTINSFVSKHGCLPLDEADIEENQILTEYLIFCNALTRANAEYDIRLSGYPINERMLDALEAESLDASAVGIWSNEAARDSLVLSAPLFRKNEFVKGLYTTAPMVARFSTFAAITQALTLTNQNWHIDWELMKCAGMTLIHVNQYEYMFNMLARGRGELIPLTFGATAQMQRQPFQTTLYPVEGYKLVFPDTTHFVLREQNLDAPALFEELNRGLAILRDEGAIESVYQRLGILNARVADWQPIQCNDSPPEP